MFYHLNLLLLLLLKHRSLCLGNTQVLSYPRNGGLGTDMLVVADDSLSTVTFFATTSKGCLNPVNKRRMNGVWRVQCCVLCSILWDGRDGGTPSRCCSRPCPVRQHRRSGRAGLSPCLAHRCCAGTGLPPAALSSSEPAERGLVLATSAPREAAAPGLANARQLLCFSSGTE